jgi:hypothetical protein
MHVGDISMFSSEQIGQISEDDAGAAPPAADIGIGDAFVVVAVVAP